MPLNKDVMNAYMQKRRQKEGLQKLVNLLQNSVNLYLEGLQTECNPEELKGLQNFVNLLQKSVNLLQDFVNQQNAKNGEICEKTPLLGENAEVRTGEKGGVGVGLNILNSSTSTPNDTVTALNDNNLNLNKKNKKVNKIVLTPEMQILFDKFWIEYPRKVDKDDAKKAFKKAFDENEGLTIETILKAVQTQNKTIWLGKDPQYIPHPTTWLHKQRWIVEQTTPSQATQAQTSQPTRSPAPQMIEGWPEDWAYSLLIIGGDRYNCKTSDGYDPGWPKGFRGTDDKKGFTDPKGKFHAFPCNVGGYANG